LPGVFLATKVKRLAFCVSLIVIIITSGSTFLPLLDGARQAFKTAHLARQRQRQRAADKGECYFLAGRHNLSVSFEV
jgi:hypothetical protein